MISGCVVSTHNKTRVCFQWFWGVSFSKHSKTIVFPLVRGMSFSKHRKCIVILLWFRVVWCFQNYVKHMCFFMSNSVCSIQQLSIEVVCLHKFGKLMSLVFCLLLFDFILGCQMRLVSFHTCLAGLCALPGDWLFYVKADSEWVDLLCVELSWG